MTDSFSMLVHSDTKVGKSTLANTSPAPRLLLDAEMAYRFLPGKKIFWDPVLEPPPILGQGRTEPHKPDVFYVDWETCVVLVRDYSVMMRAYDCVNQLEHPFVSLNVDSVSEIQKRCKDQLRNLQLDEDMSQQRWGKLLDHMEWLVRGFRDLTEHPYRPMQSVVLTAMTTQTNGKWRPYVQGQLATTMPYFLDVIGYLYVGATATNGDPTAQPEPIRQMLVEPHPQFEAGNRVQGRLPAVLDNPTVPGMITQLFGPEREAVPA